MDQRFNEIIKDAKAAKSVPAVSAVFDGQSRWREIGVAFVNAQSDTISSRSHIDSAINNHWRSRDGRLRQGELPLQ